MAWSLYGSCARRSSLIKFLTFCFIVHMVTVSGRVPGGDDDYYNTTTTGSNGTSVVELPSSSSLVEQRIYFLKKCNGGGCPYTASWLANVNLFRNVGWLMDNTKMEAVSFNIFDSARFKFQLSDPDAYFVHHMSMYEHVNHKKFGFEVARNKSLILAQASFRGECQNLNISKRDDYIAFIPFYGGLPPNVTKDLAVKSIGQGNSLVAASTKVLWAMATVCSSLKYFGRAVIGVARLEDRLLINTKLDSMGAHIRRHTNVVQFNIVKPSYLPFHMIVWGQHYVRNFNCHQFIPKNWTSSSSSSSNDIPSSTTSSARVLKGKPRRNVFSGLQDDLQMSLDAINTSALPVDDAYDICWPDAIRPSWGGPYNISYMKKAEKAHHANTHVDQNNNNIIGNNNGNSNSNSNGNGNSNSNSNSNMNGNSKPNKYKDRSIRPIRYVYYTEMDQVVRFDDDTTFKALSRASNSTTFFSGRRKEKSRDSDPEGYMESLDNWRNCGAPGYSLKWQEPPEEGKSYHVQLDAS